MNEPFNAANPKQVKAREQKSKRIEEERAAELKALLDLPQFRYFLWQHICETCGIFRTPFSTNGQLFAKDAGRQSVGLELLTAIEEINPRLIPQMMVEYAERQK